MDISLQQEGNNNGTANRERNTNSRKVCRIIDFQSKERRFNVLRKAKNGSEPGTGNRGSEARQK